MDTMSTIQAVEKTPSGAYKITFLGDAVAGTRDEDIGELAIRLAAEGDEGNPVAVSFEKQDGRVYIKGMREILPPEELGGPADEPEAVDPTVTGHAPADEAVATTEQVEEATATLESVMLSTCSDEDLLAEVAGRLSGVRRGA